MLSYCGRRRRLRGLVPDGPAPTVKSLCPPWWPRRWIWCFGRSWVFRSAADSRPSACRPPSFCLLKSAWSATRCRESHGCKVIFHTAPRSAARPTNVPVGGGQPFFYKDFLQRTSTLFIRRSAWIKKKKKKMYAFCTLSVLSAIINSWYK